MSEKIKPHLIAYNLFELNGIDLDFELRMFKGGVVLELILTSNIFTLNNYEAGYANNQERSHLGRLDQHSNFTERKRLQGSDQLIFFYKNENR
jgi:hypothetical protein